MRYPSHRDASPFSTVIYDHPVAGGSQLNELWSSTVGTGNAGPGAVKFQVPTVANGMVFVAGGNTSYAPGTKGGDGGRVNCYPAAAQGATPPTCTGLLSVYGMLHN